MTPPINLLETLPVDETISHMFRVGCLAEAFATTKKIGPYDPHQYFEAGFFHDIGKTRLDAERLYRTQTLSSGDFDYIKSHPIHGLLCFPVPFLSDDVQCAVIEHHERWDGKGYPYQKQETNLLSRIVSVCDVYDAMTSKRCYQDAKTPEEAMAYIQSQAGKQFDPLVATCFVAYLQESLLKSSNDVTIN